MKCPLPIVVLTADSFPPDNIYHDCIKEECAWWDGELKDCLIMTVTVALTGICGLLMKMEKKMPHAG